MIIYGKIRGQQIIHCKIIIKNMFSIILILKIWQKNGREEYLEKSFSNLY